jgi:hypothetical protein
MAITRIITPSITDDAVDNTKLDLASNYAFTGTVTGAGVSPEPYFRATNTGPYTFDNGSEEVIQFNSEVYDPQGTFNATGSAVTLNGISTDAFSFAPNVSGYYHLGASLHFQTVADGTSIEFKIRKNQGTIIRTMIHSGSSKDLNPFVSVFHDANGTSDDFQCAVRLDGSQENIYYASAYVTFWGYRVA